MKRTVLGLSLGVLLAAAILAGLVLREASKAPAGTAPTRVVTAVAPPEPGESRIALLAAVPLKEIEAVVRAKVPPTVVEMVGEPAKGDWRYDVTVRREAEPTVRGDEAGRLIVEVPLTLESRAYRGKKADRRAQRGAEPPSGIRLEAGLGLVLTIDYRVGSDWRVDPQVQVAHRWTGEPRLKLGPLSFPVKKPIEKKLVPKLEEAGERIRTQMVEQDTLRERIEKAWIELHQPRALEGGTGWLRTEPRSLAMDSPRVQGSSLVVPIALTAKISVVGEPPEPVPVAPLPARVAPQGDQGVRIATEVELPWSLLSARAREAVREKTWESELGQLQVREVQIYPSADQVALGLEMMVTTTGVRLPATVWFLGRPVLERDSRSVRIEGFDYSVESRAPWLDTVNHAALRETLRDQVAPRLVFPFGEQADAALARARSRPDREGLALDLQSLEVVHLGLTQEALVLHAELRGSASSTIDLEGRH